VHLRHGWMPARSLTKWPRVGPYGRMGCGLAAAAGSTRSGHAPRDSAGDSPRAVSRPGSGRQPLERTSGFRAVRHLAGNAGFFCNWDRLIDIATGSGNRLSPRLRI
jgi:hypothetical protein